MPVSLFVCNSSNFRLSRQSSLPGTMMWGKVLHRGAALTLGVKSVYRERSVKSVRSDKAVKSKTARVSLRE